MSSRIHSVYLSEEEELAIREASRLNGTSVNFVLRVAVRRLIGLAAPLLELPDLTEEQARASRSAARTD